MKNIFAFNKDSDNLDVEEYITRKLEKSNEAEFDKLEEENNKIYKKYKTPFWVNLIMYILFVGGLLCILSMYYKKLPFEENYKDHGYLFFIGIASTIIAISMYAYFYFRNKRIDKNPEVEELINRNNRLTKNALFLLGVPDDAKNIDVLIYNTKTTKNNEEKDLNNFAYNLEVYLFLENDNLCLATTHEVISFPKDSFIDILKIKKTKFLINWNKPEQTNSAKYKEFVKNTNYGIRIKYSYSIRFNYNDEELCFLIPEYDLASFLSVLNLDIKEGEENEDK